MKKYKNLFILVAILFLVYFLIPSPKYKVVFNIEPESSEVYYNGEKIDKEIKLKRGDYTFVFKLNENEQKVYVPIKGPTEIRYSFYSDVIERFNPKNFPQNYKITIVYNTANNYFESDEEKYYFKVTSPSYVEATYDYKQK